jgi:WD40 repeat protein
MAILVVLVAAAAVTFGCGEKVGSGGFSVKETVVAKIPMGGQFEALEVSGDLSRAIYVVKRGKKEVVVLDGQESKAYDAVLAKIEDDYYGGYADEFGVPRVSPPVESAAEFRFAFSPDSKRVAYAAKEGKSWFVVVDGQEGGQYDGVERILFSPDSRHIAYVAKKGESATLVVDGKEGQPSERVEDFCFNDDGTVKWLAIDGEKEIWKYTGEGMTNWQAESYSAGLQAWNLKQNRAAWVEELGQAQRVVTDGVAGKQYNHVSGIRFSPDWKRIAYVGGLPRIEGTDAYPAVMVVDGVEGPKYASVEPAVFSPDGRRIAYVARTVWDAKRGVESMVVVDGAESSHYSRATAAVFSSDSQHCAYGAQSQGKAAMYLDGKEGKTYVGVSGPTFSPDGTRIAYSATTGWQQCAVVDDKDGPWYDTVENITFSPDSKRLAYFALVGQNMFVVVDGKASEPYNGLEGLAWSPDSRHYAYRANIPPEWLLYIDGRKARLSGRSRSVTFGSDGVIRDVAYGEGGELVRFEITPE